MILIAQRSRGPKYAEVVARLTRTSHPVVLTAGTAEAVDLIADLRPDVVLVDEPATQSCPHTLCGWIREAMTRPPAMVGLVRIEDPAQRAECQECMTILDPGTHPSLIAATAAALLDE